MTETIDQQTFELLAEAWSITDKAHQGNKGLDAVGTASVNALLHAIIKLNSEPTSTPNERKEHISFLKAAWDKFGVS